MKVMRAIGPGEKTHFRVYIVSDAFKEKSRIERHRMVNAALADELAGRVHALAIQPKRRPRRTHANARVSECPRSPASSV